MRPRHSVRCSNEQWLPPVHVPAKKKERLSGDFEPAWVLVTVTFCRCSVCGEGVYDDEVWRYQETPTFHEGSVCLDCAA